jgi:SAM-dependent methyltransferase
VARRWGLHDAHDLLDVGSGVGHWSRLLTRVLPGVSRVTGVEREPRWVHEAGRRTAPSAQTSFSFVQGDALALPCRDASFDLVTCQTVLIHLPDPSVALSEMARVLRPGGHLLLAEPNNTATTLASLMLGPDDDTETVLRELRMVMTCIRGKHQLGLGHDSIGEWLPGLLDRTLFEGLDVAQCDRASPLIPPYETPAQQAAVDELRDMHERRIWRWHLDDARRYFEAGGGREFDAEWAFALERDAQRLARIARGELAQVGGQMLYLVHARRR